MTGPRAARLLTLWLLVFGFAGTAAAQFSRPDGPRTATYGALDPRFSTAVDLSVLAGAVTIEVRRQVSLERTRGLLGTRWRLYLAGLGDPIPLDDDPNALPAPASAFYTDKRDARGRLTARTDARGNTVAITRTPQGRPVRITAPKGLAFTLTLDAMGRVAAVRATTGAAVSYAYAADDLTQVRVNAGPALSYTYGSAHLPTRIDDPATGPVDITYDTRGRVTSYRWADGATERFEYDDASGVERATAPSGAVTETRAGKGGTEVRAPRAGKWIVSFDPATRTQTSTAPDGSTTRSTMDAEGRVIAFVDALRRTTRYEYSGGHLRAVIYPDGVRDEYDYDAAGNLTAERRAGVVVRSYTYNADGTIASRREDGQPEARFTYTIQGWVRTIAIAGGGTTTFTYDARGNVIRETNPLGGVTIRTFDPQDRVLTETDPAGGVTKFRYGTRGLLQSVVDPGGGTITYEYDSRGRVVMERDGAGNRTEYQYDAAGRLSRVARPGGDVETYQYDVADQLARSVRGGVSTEYRYDAQGRLVGEVVSTGLKREYAYDATGALIRESDALGRQRTYQTDVRGRATALRFGNAAVAYRYDAAGRLAGTTDALGRARELVWTPEGWLASARLANGDEARYRYDAGGRLLEIARPGGGQMRFTYDAAGNVTSMVEGTGPPRKSTHDKAGRQISVTDEAGQTTLITYDAAGRIVSRALADKTTITLQHDSAGRITSLDDGRAPVRYKYDTAGRVIEAEYPALKKSLRMLYDSRGMRTGLVTATGASIGYGYNPAGQLSDLALPNGSRLKLTYDARDRLAGIEYPNGVTGRIEYDGEDLVVRVHYADRNRRAIASAEYKHDAAGNPTERRDQDRRVTEFAYDAAGQLTQETAGRSVTRYGYAAGGRRTSLERDGQKTTYEYDADERLVRAQNETFRYSPRGELISRGGGQGDAEYSYDSQGQLSKVARGGESVEYTYWPTGERLSRSDRAGRKYFLYDGLDLLHELDADFTPVVTYVHLPAADRPIAMIRGGDVFFFHADRNGSILALTDSRGQTVSSYEYDAFGNFRARKEGPPNPFGFTGREYDAATGLYYYRARYYDPSTGRFLSRDPVADLADPLSLNPYIYARNSPVRYVDPLGLSPELTGDPTKVLGSDMKIWKNLGEQVDWFRYLKSRGPSNPHYQEAIESLRVLEPKLVTGGPHGDAMGRIELQAARQALPPQGVARAGRPPAPRAGGGAGGTAPPPTVAAGAPPQPTVGAPAPAAHGTPAAGSSAASNAPARPAAAPRAGRGITIENGNPKYAGPIMIAISVAQIAACIYNNTPTEDCIWGFVMSMGVAAGVQVTITLVAGPGVAATAMPVIGVIAALGFTGVQVTQAGREAWAAGRAMLGADAAAYQLALQFQAQAEQLKKLRDGVQSQDRRSRRSTLEADQLSNRASELMDEAERGLAGLSASGLCAEAGELQAKLDGYRATATRMLTDARAQYAQASAKAGTCRTAAQAADVRRHLTAAGQVERAMATLVTDAEAAKRRLTAIIPKLVRSEDDSKLQRPSDTLAEAGKLIIDASKKLEESSKQAQQAIPGQDDFAERVRKLRKEIDDAEKRHNDLSWQEWIVDLFRSQRVNVKKEFDSARSVLNGVSAPEVTAGNTDEIEKFAAAAAKVEAQRRRFNEIRGRMRALECSFEATGDPLNDVRQAYDDARVEAERHADLTAAADACATGAQTPAPRPDRPDREREQPRPPRPDPPPPPDPIPVLTATLDCGPAIEVRPAQMAKSCGVIVRGWNSRTATPVRVLIEPNPTSAGIRFSPGNTQSDPGTMHSTGASDYADRYVFQQGVSASERAVPGTRLAFSIVVTQGAQRVALPLTVNVIAAGAPDGSGLDPVGPIIQGTGGAMCVFRYKTMGDPAQCWSFASGSCASSRFTNSQYERVAENLTASQASAVVEQKSRYYSDQYGCRAAQGSGPPPPVPPAQVITGRRGGELCVWRYKLRGDAPQCFHVAIAQCGRYGPPYELIGQNMSRAEAQDRADQISRYFNDEYGCNATITQPPRTEQNPPSTPPDDPDPPVPPTPPVRDPDPPAPPRPSLSRFGIVGPRTVKVGETIVLTAHGVMPGASDIVYDLTDDVRWTPSNRITGRREDVGKRIRVTATHPLASDTVEITVVEAPPAAPVDTVPDDLGGNRPPRAPTGDRQPVDRVPGDLGPGTTPPRTQEPQTPRAPPDPSLERLNGTWYFAGYGGCYVLNLSISGFKVTGSSSFNGPFTDTSTIDGTGKNGALSGTYTGTYSNPGCISCKAKSGPRTGTFRASYNIADQTMSWSTTDDEKSMAFPGRTFGSSWTRRPCGQ